MLLKVIAGFTARSCNPPTPTRVFGVRDDHCRVAVPKACEVRQDQTHSTRRNAQPKLLNAGIRLEQSFRFSLPGSWDAFLEGKGRPLLGLSRVVHSAN